MKGAGVHDPGQLHLELNLPVLLEIPVEAVLVVADGGDEGDDEPAAAPHLGFIICPPVHVLPEDPGVLLMKADRVLDRVDLSMALVGGEVGVEVPDLAQAVAAQGQGVGEKPDPEFAAVEGVLREKVARVGEPHTAPPCRRAKPGRGRAGACHGPRTGAGAGPALRVG